MNIVCLDLEGVLVPEIWIAFSEATGIPELRRTTRDEPDYDKLMKYRIGILKEHGLGLKEIQNTIAGVDPMPGAKEFLDELRSITQVLILSDTFTQFAGPLMKKLGWGVNDVDLFEINEAFAVVTLMAMDDLGLPHDKVNVFGGACAQGHPIGSTGSRVIATLIHALRTKGGKRGIASLCIGGGEATAVAVELID